MPVFGIWLGASPSFMGLMVAMRSNKNSSTGGQNPACAEELEPCS